MVAKCGPRGKGRPGGTVAYAVPILSDLEEVE
jgi:hypothetical protein